jgi:hypothetical protein
MSACWESELWAPAPTPLPAGQMCLLPVPYLPRIEWGSAATHSWAGFLTEGLLLPQSWVLLLEVKTSLDTLGFPSRGKEEKRKWVHNAKHCYTRVLLPCPNAKRKGPAPTADSRGTGRQTRDKSRVRSWLSRERGFWLEGRAVPTGQRAALTGISSTWRRLIFPPTVLILFVLLQQAHGCRANEDR